MEYQKKLLLFTSLIAASIIFVGCAEEGENGLTSLTIMTPEPEGDNCFNGGVKIDIGLDSNKDGVLSSDEIEQTEYVCNGMTAEEECLAEAGGYRPIMVGGRIWLDRNLGAGRVGVDANDTLAFGSYYQWGRGADGHQYSDSNTTDIKSDSLTPSHGDFIAVEGDWFILPVDGTVVDNRDILWSTPKSNANLNQVCPCGYVVPSLEDFYSMFEEEVAELKLPNTGFRSYNYGDMLNQALAGYYWTTNSADGRTSSVSINTNNGNIVEFSTGDRSNGYAVRCIKP